MKYQPEGEAVDSAKPASFIAEKSQPYIYLKISLDIDGENPGELNGNQYKFLIVQAIKENLGQVGAATPVDLLKLCGDGTSIIRIPYRNGEKIWAALTLFGATPAGNRCAFRVMQASPFLMGLAFNSREQGESTTS